ncbi:MAG: hypothetical protein KBA81_02770 [Rhabdochlamydiaceae bacterium]|nr:hypothetical protein [Rhabdochlamydiaceae bacterium]
MVSPNVDESVATIRYLFCALPILMATVHCIWRKNFAGFSKADCFLTYFLTIGVGLQGLLVGNLEIYHSDIVAASVGWPSSPYIAELGKANIAFGVLGVLSFWFRGGWGSATALGYGLFILMRGVGHYETFKSAADGTREIVGSIVATDFILAASLFILLAIRRIYKS